jgi:hypothetical protein
MEKQHYVAIRDDGTILGIILGAREKEVKSNLRAALASRYQVHTSHFTFTSFEAHGSDYRAVVRIPADAGTFENEEEIHLEAVTVHGKV